MKKVLVVVSEKGYTWDEVFYPYVEFQRQGWEAVFATPTGGEAKADPLSVKVRPVWSLFGYGTSRGAAPESKKGRELTGKLEEPLSLSQADADAYDAIFVVGGHGSLFDLNRNGKLHELLFSFLQAGRPVGLLCHSSSTLAFMEKGGQPFLKGRRITGFPTLWEHGVLKAGWVHEGFLPLPVWTGKEIDRAATGRTWFDRIAEAVNPWYAIREGNLITGVGPKTGGRVARLMMRQE
ncbi:MAG: DJ-1/PfpI family protein [bacterium]|nr:DJ-1/PfpI family protein [bacterium]